MSYKKVAFVVVIMVISFLTPFATYLMGSYLVGNLGEPKEEFRYELFRSTILDCKKLETVTSGRKTPEEESYDCNGVRVIWKR